MSGSLRASAHPVNAVVNILVLDCGEGRTRVSGLMQAQIGDITLEYDTFGSPDDPTILLVMGLATQMIAWQPAFCQMLADHGFQVVRFDNRDIGLSTKHDGVPSGIDGLPSAFKLRITGKAPYYLSDLANDAFGLLDFLGTGPAHVVGVSMGGMIVQQMAISHPERLLSMTSIMSTTGSMFVGHSKLDAMKMMFRPEAKGREEAIAGSVNARRIISPHHFDLGEARRWAEAAFDRSHYPEGSGRQLAAIFASGNRTKALQLVTVPTLVIHGEIDPLVNISGGRATAKAISGSTFKSYPTMGHDLPEPLWPDFVADITTHAKRATAQAIA